MHSDSDSYVTIADAPLTPTEEPTTKKPTSPAPPPKPSTTTLSTPKVTDKPVPTTTTEKVQTPSTKTTTTVATEINPYDGKWFYFNEALLYFLCKNVKRQKKLCKNVKKAKKVV